MSSANVCGYPESIELEFFAQDSGGAVICNPARQEYFKVGDAECDFIRSLDGSRSVEELERAFNKILQPHKLRELLDWLTENNLLVGADTRVETRGALKWVLDWFRGAKRLRILLPNPDRLLRRFDLSYLFGKPAVMVYWLLTVAPMVVLVAMPEMARRMIGNGIGTIGYADWIWVALLVLGTVAIHELAHAISCVHLGGRVNKLGIMFIYLVPAVFCDVTSSWSFQNRRDKIIVAAAGLIAHVLLACLLFLLWVAFDWVPLLYAAGACLGLVVMNMLPIVKLDGYWILVHLLGEPNLRAKSLSSVLAVIRSPSRINQALGCRLFYFGLVAVAGAVFFSIAGLMTIHSLVAIYSVNAADFVASAVAGLLVLRLWISHRTNQRTPK